jgi:signal transduction histidine kinase/CheY-like chemotaxis protein
MAKDRRHILFVRNWIVLTGAWLLCAISLTGQSQYKHVYYPVASRSYGIEDGMPDRCVEYVFIDQAGRLKIIPCTYVQAGQAIYLYQFDGRRSYRQEVPVISAGNQWSIVPCQATAEGNLYGYLVEDADSDSAYTECFTYQTDQGTWQVIAPPVVDGAHLIVRSVRMYDEAMYVLAFSPGSFHIYRRVEDTWRSQVVIPGPVVSGRLRTNLAFAVDEEYFWVEDWRGVVYRVVRDDSSHQILEPNTNDPRGALTNNFLTLPGGEVLYCVSPLGEIILPDFADGVRRRYTPWSDPDPGSAGNTTQYFAYRDRRGNVLFVRFDPGQPYRGWLVEVDGASSDYTEALADLPGQEADGLKFYHLVSEDFTRSLFVTGREFMAIEVASRGSVQAIPTLPMRGMIELADSVLVFSRNMTFDGNVVHTNHKHPSGCFEPMQVDGDIVRTNTGTYLYVIRGKGLYAYDIALGTCQLIYDNNRIQRIAADDKGWIYTLANNKLYKLEPRTYAVDAILDTAIHAFVNEISIAASGIVYLASSDGLSYVDMESHCLVPVDINQGGQNEPVLSTYEDRRGRLWLGTHGSGLKVYDPGNGQVISITVEEGLSNNIIASTIEDREGDIWVGTYNGITIFDQEANILGYVYEESGLIDNECNRWAASVLQDGRLYFGSTGGFSLIDPQAVKQKIAEMEPLNIYPTFLEFDGQTMVNGEGTFGQAVAEGITIPAYNRSLRIGYGLSSYASPQSNRFAYKLNLPGSSWNFVGALYNLSLSDLPTGQYDLLIKGTNFRGRVSSNVISLPLNVRQYFYKTWWFYTLCALPFAVFAFLWMKRQRSERRRLEQEVDKRTQTIREQTEALKELDMHKTRLYTNITHEFRTPLTVIKGLVDQVHEDVKAPELIRRNADSLLNLVNQMLELRKLESGNLVYEPVHGNIVWFLQYVGESFRSLAETRSQRFHFLSELKKIEMDYDPDKLTRVVANLLSNAIKFTPAGGDIYLHVEGARIKDDILEIKVIDTGIGIPEDQLEKVFDRFYQVDDSHIRRGEGTGIGLTLVSEFVKLMDGTVRVSSKPGSGTTFVISLPVTRVATREEWTELPALQGSLMSGMLRTEGEQITEERHSGIERHRVLIVEDNPDVVHYIGSCLKDEYHLMVALDGQEGIEKALEQIPDIVISDVMMPEKDGFELCETIKQDERTSHIPIILLTAKADFESRLQGLVRGADAYLAKPFDKEELLIHIAKLIEQRAVLQKRYAASAPLLSPSSDPGVQIEDAFITRVNAVLMANIDKEDFGIDELCTAVHLGRTQLHSKLKALTGKSTGLYIRALRIAESVRFLADSNLNVSEVAYAVGFSDPKYFARTFKQEFGVTPSEWRENATETR